MTELQNDLLLLSTVIPGVAVDVEKSLINSEVTELDLLFIRNKIPYPATTNH
jgi:hypothetical protein